MGQENRLRETPHCSLGKISRPRLGQIVHRDRLSRQCEKLSSCPCIWITAPAGYGKTTHIVDYLDNKDISCLWYQVDEADAYLATFFSYIGMAVESHTGNSPPLLTPEYFSDIPTFTRRWFRQVYRMRLINPP